ncbi:MAG: Na(+)-translocating NADH-quinone reductase subunit B [Candidatus Moanabacter tarae]|uniref:Na(+)-translocating NADH-quinone reductase subunit B n=1 Tax=Candidatus Moanibacter tarae TaxID=2200854 RepID=A0A2Z4AH22_9BACT|nr:MAG: Na(+)-translocating NADH-quinone reductase subunit B [Candidatus Moanabacter tarae]|tara:strand:- start:63883 stop:65091 length:1209 start_codon:yes stop_codon:yes gene_type:complete
MKFLRNILDNLHPQFDKGGKLEKLYPIYEAIDTFFYTPGEVTEGASHVRDGMDLKRMMVTVIVALVPCMFMAMYNTGHQANSAMASMGVASAEGWRAVVIESLGFGYAAESFISNLIHGALYFIPIFLVCNIVGVAWEVLFASIRKHEVNEGFLVTGALFPLTLPPTIPLWQVAVGITFGVVVGKEIFGGTGRNFLNPALTARAFVFFAYPAQMSGDFVWTAVDGFSGATPLGLVAAEGMEPLTQQMTWTQAFIGQIQGSMGETSTLACLLGAGLLILTGVGSARIMSAVLISALLTSSILFLIGSDTNPMFQMSPIWHLVLGGFAFGLVFMATDPVSAAMSSLGQWIYGFLIGFLVILIRVINPAFAEGMMLAILFGNVFAPIIDQLVIKTHIKRRALRNA